MIPKTIHYCWFGKNRKSKLVQRCINSWRSVCPDYEIVEWNDDNFKFDQYPFLEWCHEQHKWAYMSDMARLLVIEQYGGIYFDTDVELIKDPIELLDYKAFFGRESANYVATGLGYGAMSHHPIVQDMIKEYASLRLDKVGDFHVEGCPIINTRRLLDYGLILEDSNQIINDTIVCNTNYFNPYNPLNGKLNINKDTVSIHWYMQSALTKWQKARAKIMFPLRKLMKR